MSGDVLTQGGDAARESASGHHDAPRDAAWVYHDGAFVRAGDAGFNLHERGVTFGDGVYEVVRYDGGRGFALDRHVARMRRSLAAIEIEGVDPAELAAHSDELLRRNDWTHAKAYWQVTRGRQPRDFVMDAKAKPTVTAWLAPVEPMHAGQNVAQGAAVWAEDIRWLRCDIKSLLLMPASLARTRASRAGAVEALFVRDKPSSGGGVASLRHVTEGTSTNVIAVVDGALVTHPTDRYILAGVTRAVLLEHARASGREVQERAMTPDELLAADELLVCSTTQVTAITSIEGAVIGEGQVGPVTQLLHGAYVAMVLAGRGV
ncbi:MAG: aminotransferase class IV [Algisphaera sp.]